MRLARRKKPIDSGGHNCQQPRPAAECRANTVENAIRVRELGCGMDLAEQPFHPAQRLDAADSLREGGGMDVRRRSLLEEREMEVLLNREAICELAILPRGIAETLVEGILSEQLRLEWTGCWYRRAASRAWRLPTGCHSRTGSSRTSA